MQMKGCGWEEKWLSVGMTMQMKGVWPGAGCGYAGVWSEGGYSYAGKEGVNWAWACLCMGVVRWWVWLCR